MYTPRLKCSETPLEHLRPSSGHVCPRPRTPDPSTEVRVALNKVAWVIRELLDTELAYVESLRDIKEGYYLPLLVETKFDATTLQTVFSNVAQLHSFHQTFSGKLSRNQENLVSLANVFLEYAADFEKLYVHFCTEHSLSIQTLQQERHLQTELWTAILSCQSRLGHLLPLASYLLKPVQRVLKYQLLLQELVKGCALAGLGQDQPIFTGDPNSTVERLQSALERMIQVATHINEAKRRQELIGQLQASGLDVCQWGHLLLRDVFRLPAKKHSFRLVLLFERAILLAKKFSYAGNNSAPNLTDLQSFSGEGLQSVLEIRDIISCSNLMLIECIDKDPLAFHILPFNNPDVQKTLQASNKEVKQQWCREIKRVILENFDATIPEKAKQLMIHMDDICGQERFPQLTEESEEEQVHRRKGSNVLTAIFKRRGRTVRAFAKLQADDGVPPPSTVTPNCAGDDDCGDFKADEDDADHVALVQDAWNALMAKHSFSTPTVAADLAPAFSSTSVALADRQEVSRAEEDEEEDDFRCIAVEINEERFAVDLTPPQKLPEFKPTSPPKGWQNSSTLNPVGASIYIDCQEASQYDTVTFGRAYEQYIAKTRSMATLSPGEMDEILRPLLTLTEDHSLSNPHCINEKPKIVNGGSSDHLLPILASGDDCSGAPSTASSSSSMSVCQLVSRIAIDSLNCNGDSGIGRGARRITPSIPRKAHRPPRSAAQSRLGKEISRPPITSLTTCHDTAKASPVRKHSAPLPTASIQRSKPPRTPALPKTDNALLIRSNRLVSESGTRIAPRLNGAKALSKPVSSTPTSVPLAKANHDNEGAVTRCQGRLRASACQGVPKTTNNASARPIKPQHGSALSAKTRECSNGGARSRITPQTSTASPNVPNNQGHVRHLINRFQNN